MPYAIRNSAGEIIALLRDEAPGVSELLEGEHPEVVAFVGRSGGAKPFTGLDAEFVRVVEDLIDTLVGKGVVRVTDLPLAAQRKLRTRKDVRERMREAVDPLDKGRVV